MIAQKKGGKVTMALIEDRETFVSVDIETAGAAPGAYSLLAIGACTLARPGAGRATFYVELKPDKDRVDETAMAVHGLDPVRLAEEGVAPEEALLRFEEWALASIPPGKQPLFLAFNAPFDWMFVNDYFVRYLGRNPFGHNAIDIKAVYMGAARCRWSETSSKYLRPRYLGQSPLSHNALEDAIDQATVFEGILREYFGAR